MMILVAGGARYICSLMCARCRKVGIRRSLSTMKDFGRAYKPRSVRLGYFDAGRGSGGTIANMGERRNNNSYAPKRGR